jgi:hypothetical protein
VLPISTVREAEGTIMRELVGKYSFGEEGRKATHFPELAEALSVYPFKTTEARRMQTVVEELAKLYKNDVMVSRATGGISLDAFNSYLTTSPVARAQMQVASEFFNYAAQMTGGAKSNTRALINNVTKFLENPLNPRTTSHLVDEVKENQTFLDAIEAYQKEAAAAKASGQTDQFTRVRTYKDREGNMYMRPRSGLIPGESITAKNIAREDYIRDQLHIDIADLNKLSRYEKARLIEQGFEAVALNNGQVIKLF